MDNRVKGTVIIYWQKYSRRTDTLAKVLNCEVLFIKILKSRKIFWKLFFGVDYLVKVVIPLLYLLKKEPELSN